MSIFNKENGTPPQSNVPLKILKKFFNMSKITSFNLVLQRNGEKNSHVLDYKINKKNIISLG